MALFKTCRCGKTIPAEERMCSDCWKKNRNSIKKINNKYNLFREDKEEIAFYNTTLWKRVANKVRGRYLNCCAICFCNSEKLWKDLKEVSNLNYFTEDGKRKNLIHHIIELKEDRSKATSESNLICVCEKHHSAIHKIYDNGNKEELQKELLELVARWDDFL